VNPFEIAIYVSLFLAIAMIVVGLRLLAKGVIKLSEAGTTAEGLSIELFNKIKVQTGYPAIAFFGLGIVLIVLAIFFTKPAGDLSLSFEGKLSDVDPELVTGKVVPVRDSGETFRPDSDGSIRRPLNPEFPVEVQINAAGYEPEPWHRGLALGRGKTLTIDLSKEVKFTKKPDSKPPVPVASIAPAEDLKNVPSVQEGKGLKQPPSN
jgi:hypothetical protein